jgi:hypothetical protein
MRRMAWRSRSYRLLDDGQRLGGIARRSLSTACPSQGGHQPGARSARRRATRQAQRRLQRDKHKQVHDQ